MADSGTRSGKLWKRHLFSIGLLMVGIDDDDRI